MVERYSSLCHTLLVVSTVAALEILDFFFVFIKRVRTNRRPMHARGRTSTNAATEIGERPAKRETWRRPEREGGSANPFLIYRRVEK